VIIFDGVRVKIGAPKKQKNQAFKHKFAANNLKNAQEMNGHGGNRVNIGKEAHHSYGGHPARSWWCLVCFVFTFLLCCFLLHHP